MKHFLKCLVSFLSILLIMPFFVIGILLGMVWIGTTAGIQTARDFVDNKGYLNPSVRS